MNMHSSRSHAIFSVTVECSEKGPDGKHHVRAGKLHLVDLAVSYCIHILHNLIYTDIYIIVGQILAQSSIR